jgi:hypothetical protein
MIRIRNVDVDHLNAGLKALRRRPNDLKALLNAGFCNAAAAFSTHKHRRKPTYSQLKQAKKTQNHRVSQRRPVQKHA